MVVDIKMCRFDNVPWGFRLVGGADFEIPLTVVKVSAGSIAELAGLRVGDVIVRINDNPALPLLHDEAHNIITHCGNVFYFGVQRENEPEPEDVPKHFPVQSVAECPRTPDSFLDVGSSKTYSDDMRGSAEYLTDLKDRPNSVLSDRSETKLVEQEIAAVLSGESEVLREHNVMGIFPKPGVCMTSEVLRTLNEDAVKTKAEKEKENKKWTTFLQKPDRPIPRSRAQIEAEQRAANAYKVKIVKSAPKATSPDVQKQNEIEAIVEPEKEPEKEPEREPEEAPIAAETTIVEAPTPTDSEVPNLEQPTFQTLTTSQEEEEGDIEQEEHQTEEKADQQKETTPELPEREEDERNKEAESRETLSVVEEDVEEAQREQKKTPEEIALQRQLADVQKQLQALSTLPSTIQATLDAVTKQLGEMLPTFKLQQVQPVTKMEVREINLESIAESREEERVAREEQTEHNTVADGGNTASDDGEEMEGVKSLKGMQIDSNLAQDLYDFHEELTQDPLKLQKTKEHKEETRQMEEEQNVKKQKRHEVIEELEEHLERKNTPKAPRSKRAFGPLTPSSERPLVLPGGRRWYRPKDAYNDEFIAETLSAQAELITGSTLGNMPYESPLLGYDSKYVARVTATRGPLIELWNRLFTAESISRPAFREYHGASVALLDRVNFMKYQKPEKKIDLNRSEVYKIIHHLDRKPVRGIEVRAPLVPAAVDIRKAIES